MHPKPRISWQVQLEIENQATGGDERGNRLNVLVRANEVVVWTENGIIHKSTNNETKNCNRVNLSPMLSLGIDYKINDKMNLRVEPTARFGVLSVLDGSIKEYLYSGGLNLSYYFGL